MSFHIRKLAVRPPVKFKQATLSISLNKTDILLPYYISKVHSMFPLGISLETIIVAIFFFFLSEMNLRTETAEELLCGHNSSKPSRISQAVPAHAKLCRLCPLPSHLLLCVTWSYKSEGTGFSPKPCQVQVLVLPVTSQRTLHKTHKC